MSLTGCWNLINKNRIMTQTEKTLPNWILIISALFALMEIMVSFAIIFAPESVLETVDLKAKGVDYLIYLWASRQFALGFIFAFATIKKSIPMLLVAYIFFLVMFIGDLLIGISQKESGLIGAAVVMCVVSSVMIWMVNKRR